MFLTEMSFKRKMAINKIEEIAPALLRHIFILMVFPTSREKNHWLSEIDNFLADIFITYGNIKKKRSLSKKEYQELLINGPLIAFDQYSHIKKYISYAIKKESDLLPSFYHNALTIEDLNIIFVNIKSLLNEVIIKGMSEESISKNEFKQLMEKYIWNMPIYRKK